MAVVAEQGSTCRSRRCHAAGRQLESRPEIHVNQRRRTASRQTRSAARQAANRPAGAALSEATDSTARTSSTRSAANGPSSMSNLATYRLPQRRPQQRWLDACIRHAVQNLDEAPFLQAASLEPEPQLRRFQVPSNVGNAPQLWDGIVKHLSDLSMETSSVLYVSPVVIGETAAQQAAVSCITSAACDSASEVLTGVATGSAAPVLTGHVGDCCDDNIAGPRHSPDSPGESFSALSSSVRHQHFSSMGASLDTDHLAQGSMPDSFKHSYAKASQIVPYIPLRRGAGEPTAPQDEFPEGRMRAGTMDEGQLQRLWGVVVQSSVHGGMEGCYVLKTLSNTAADCQCTSYTLTKVCDGMPNTSQISEAWL